MMDGTLCSISCPVAALFLYAPDDIIKGFNEHSMSK